MTATHTGKQVFIAGRPVADAYSEDDAAMIVAALNADKGIAAYLEGQAAKCNQSLKDIPEDSVLWTDRRIAARTFRIAADNVRAGFWRDGA